MIEKQKHILVLSSWYPNARQPFLGNFVQQQLKLLASNYQITFLHVVAESGITAATVQENNSGLYKELIVHYPAHTNKIIKAKRRKSAFYIGLRHVVQPDLILGEIVIPAGDTFVWAKQRFRCPLIYVEHGSFYSPQMGYRWRFLDKFKRHRIGLHADEIIAVSELLANAMQPYFPNRKIEVIPNHVDAGFFTAELKKTNDQVRFLHVSTLDRRTKRVDQIIDACAALVQQGVDFRMTIVSDEDYSWLEQYIKDSGLSEIVTCIGPLTPADLVSHYHVADAFVLFSKYETFSLVLAEALATGTPVISTRVGICSDANDKLGIAVETVAELTAAMASVARRERVFDQQEIQKSAEQFGADAVLESWKKIIERYD